jgi:adenylate cyclase
MAGAIEEEAEYITALTGALRINLDRYEAEKKMIEDTVKDKFCILGRVDTGTTDIGANPFYAEYINVGTHGVVLDMILSETFIIPIGIWWRVLFTIVFVMMFFLVTRDLSPVPRAVSGFLITTLLIAIAAMLFRFTGIFFNPFLLTLSMVTAAIIREIVSYAGSEREKQFIRKAFSTYVSQDVVKEIIADPSRLQLGGTKRHMTTIFTDVKGFSGISEQLDPENLVTLLNRYLTSLSDTILEQHGTIDKYVGDAIVAFFGAPVPMEDHAIRACVSAIAMKRVEAALNVAIMEEKLSPLPLLTRIGINTGNMVAGNMGTQNKMNYTIMGNAVNLAARLEGVNKQYGTYILVSDDTIKETGDMFLTRKLDRVRVVGINEPIRIYELLDTRKNADTEQTTLVEVFHQALDRFEMQNWQEAMEGFRESFSIEHGGPSEIFLKRCEDFIINPPTPDWDGVANMTDK